MRRPLAPRRARRTKSSHAPCLLACVGCSLRRISFILLGRAPIPVADNVAKRRRRQGPREEGEPAGGSAMGIDEAGGAPSHLVSAAVMEVASIDAAPVGTSIDLAPTAYVATASCSMGESASETITMEEEPLMPPMSRLQKASSQASVASSVPVSIDALCEQLANAQMAVRQVLEAGLAPESGLHLDGPLRAQLQVQLAHTQDDLSEMQRLAAMPSGRDSQASGRDSARSAGAQESNATAEPSCQQTNGSRSSHDSRASLSTSSWTNEAPMPKRNSLGDTPRSKSEGTNLSVTSVHLTRGAPMDEELSTAGRLKGSSGRRVSFKNLTMSNPFPSKPAPAKEHFSEKIDRHSGIRRGASDSRMLNDTSRKTSLTEQLRRIFLGSPRRRH